MYNVSMPWKEFKVELSALHDWLKANAGEKYCGMSAHAALDIHFTEEPNDDIKLEIEVLWEGLTEADEKVKMDLAADLEAAVVTAKTALLTMDLTTMNQAERKLFMNMPLTDDDKNSLLLKYPQGGNA